MKNIKMKKIPFIAFIVVLSFVPITTSTNVTYGSSAFTSDIRSQTENISLTVDPKRNQLTVLLNGSPFKKYPIALGKPESPTPVGQWKIINKHENWGTGFGTRWMGLNVPWGIFGIHGTNKPFSIGHDASHGCIRMYNRDVEELYEWVHIGTPVWIIGHPLGEPDQLPRSLAVGDSGADVLLIQYRLRSAGIYNGPCDGRFGLSTAEALRVYEKNNGLPVDGVMNLHDYQQMGLLE